MKAQYYKEKELLVGASVGYQYPLGDFGDQAKGGPAFRVTGQMMLNKRIGVGAEIAYSILGQDNFWNGNHFGNYDVNYNCNNINMYTYMNFVFVITICQRRLAQAEDA